MDLLCYCWREGWIPADSSAIAQLCNCHDLAIVEPCLSLFDSHPNDEKKLIHKRLDREREKQLEHSNERSNSGKKGAEARWGKGKRADGSAIKKPLAKNSSSSSSSTSVNTNTLKSIRVPFSVPSVEEINEYGKTLTPPLTTAAKFWDHHQSKGWVIGRTPMKDWKAAVRTWHSNERSFAPNSAKSTLEKETLFDDSYEAIS